MPGLAPMIRENGPASSAALLSRRWASNTVRHLSSALEARDSGPVRRAVIVLCSTRALFAAFLARRCAVGRPSRQFADFCCGCSNGANEDPWCRIADRNRTPGRATHMAAAAPGILALNLHVSRLAPTRRENPVVSFNCISHFVVFYASSSTPPPEEGTRNDLARSRPPPSLTGAVGESGRRCGRFYARSRGLRVMLHCLLIASALLRQVDGTLAIRDAPRVPAVVIAPVFRPGRFSTTLPWSQAGVVIFQKIS